MFASTSALAASALLMSIFPAAHAHSEDRSLVLHYRFDQAPEGGVLKDLSSYQHDGKMIDAEWHPELEGRKGVLRFNGTSAYLDVPNYGPLWFDGDATFELWVRQHSVQTTGAMLIFAENPPHVSYTLNVSQDYAMVFTTAKLEEGMEREVMSHPVPRRFLDDQWAHLAIVVEYPRCRFYRDGKLVWDQFMPLDGLHRMEKRELRIAGNPTSKQFSPIDLSEFRFYRRALSAEEVAAHAQGKEADLKPRSELQTHADWYRKQLEVRYFLKGEPSTLETTVTLTPEGGAPQERKVTLKEVSRNGSHRYEARADFDLAGLEGAKVSLEAGEGALLQTSALALVAPDWIKAKAGVSPSIPTPWIPVKVSQSGPDDLQLDVLLRRYHLNGSIFPEQITAREAELLSAPVALSAQVKGRELEWKRGELKVTAKGEREVKLEQEWRAGPLVMKVKSETEFDGYMIFECELTASEGTDLEGLKLDLPLQSRHASLCYGDKVFPLDGVNYTSIYYSGAISGPLDFLFSPNIWVGDRERGLVWQAESNEDWRNSDPQKAIRITPKGETTLFAAHFVDQPTRLEPGSRRVYRFALMATPVKPLARDGWDLRIARYEPLGTDFELPYRYIGKQREVDAIAGLGVRYLYNFISDIFAWPMPVHDAYAKALRTYVDTVQGAGVKVHPYVIHQRFPVNVAEFDGYGFHMAKRPLAGNYVQPLNHWPINWKRPGTPAVNYGADSAASIFMCPKSEPLQDAFLHSLQQRLREYGEDGVYLDGTVHIVPCCNEEHGCGYLDEEGKRHDTYPVFGVRRMMQRIYTLVREAKGEEGMVDVHCSFGYNPAGLAYADIMWNGEQWHHLRHTGAEYVAGELPLDMFCTEFLGHQLGIASEILHYRLRHTSKIAATSLLHDISPRYSLGGFDNSTQSVGGFMTVIPKLWKLRDEFGTKEAKTRFYWDNADVVTLAKKETYATLFHHPSNGVLVLISNLGREGTQVEARFQLAGLGLEGKEVEVFDPLTQEKVAMNAQGEISFPLGSEEWRYLWMKPTLP